MYYCCKKYKLKDPALQEFTNFYKPNVNKNSIILFFFFTTQMATFFNFFFYLYYMGSWIWGLPNFFSVIITLTLQSCEIV